MLRIGSIISLLLAVTCLFGCGLFGGSQSHRFQETPAYYHQTQRDEMIEHAKIYRQSELGRLEQGATELETEKKREDALAAEKSKKKKNRFKDWFGTGDETFLMSSEAKRINSNLER